MDPDANIILGATFDEELEGVIRVSVVATGIENTGLADKVAPAEIRTAARAAAPATAPARPAAPVAQPTAAPVAAAPVAAPQPQARPAIDPVAAAIRQAEAEFQPAPAPVQHVAAAQDDFRPASRLFQGEPVAAQPAPVRPVAPVQQPVAAAPIQQAAPVEAAQPRMPRVEDFPPVVKAELEARAATQEDHEDRGPMGLLKRLTNGLSRRDEEAASLKPAHPAQAPREPQLRQPQPEARRVSPQDPSVYAPRRGQLDEHGRLRPAQPSAHEDDQLEIPAFLRRQAN